MRFFVRLRLLLPDNNGQGRISAAQREYEFGTSFLPPTFQCNYLQIERPVQEMLAPSIFKLSTESGSILRRRVQ